MKLVKWWATIQTQDDLALTALFVPVLLVPSHLIPTPFLWYLLKVVFYFPVNKICCSQKWYKPEFLTPVRILSEAVSFILFLLWHKTKNNSMKNMTWQHHLYYRFSHIWISSLKQYLLWQKLAYFCCIVNYKNNPLVVRFICVHNSWANISTEKKNPNWED